MKNNNWISVKEKLPKKEQIVLGYNGGTPNIYIFSKKTFKTWEITHWQPLPEPPK